MKKCVKLLFEVVEAQKVLESFIANQAVLFKVEGLGQHTGICNKYRALSFGTLGTSATNIDVE